MMDSYDTELDKIALAVESAKTAKSMIVKTEGIGEELNITLMAWSNNSLRVVAQMHTDAMKDKEGRLGRLIKVGCVLRQGWDIDEFTLFAEGYLSKDLKATDGRDMAQVYAEQNSPVVECLSFTHIQVDDVINVAVPYTLAPPRTVHFQTPLKYEGEGIFRESQYIDYLQKCLFLDTQDTPDDLDVEEFHSALAEALVLEGFEINYK
jgi:hypothetical protein